MAVIRFFISSFLIGWKIESNWTRPFWFFVYHAIRPFATVFLTVFMYKAVLGADFHNPVFKYIYVGITFWTIVQSALFGISWSVLSDREFYETLKYMNLLPYPYYLHLAGRSFALFLLSIFSISVLIITGVFFLKLKIFINLYLIFYLFIGYLIFVGIGYIMASLLLVLPRFAWIIQEGMAGIIFLLSGVIYSPYVLPGLLKKIAVNSPLTVWLDLIRNSMGIRLYDTKDPLFLVFLSFFLLFSGIFIFNIMEKIARKKGTLEETTGG